MMHGYIVFDQNGDLLVPFRTWRNTNTEEAAEKLTELFRFHIPLRWSIAHLYQAILNREEHVSQIDFMTTLAGYVHWRLTGRRVLGIGDASGMFPVDSVSGGYQASMVWLFHQCIGQEAFAWKLDKILPEVLTAGEEAGRLTKDGAALLNPSGALKDGIPFCPPEGDAGAEIPMDEIYSVLYRSALNGDMDCGRLMAYCYDSGEHITGFEKGCPLFVRTPESRFNLSNFMKTHLFTSLGALKIGMDILVKQERVRLDRILGHGGLFKTKNVGQQIMAAALGVPVAVMNTAGEGGAWGIALLASYFIHRDEAANLAEFLEQQVFASQQVTTVEPDPQEAESFEKFMERYSACLPIERAAVNCMTL